MTLEFDYVEVLYMVKLLLLLQNKIGYHNGSVFAAAAKVFSILTRSKLILISS
jgi:hypothetical protein